MKTNQAFSMERDDWKSRTSLASVTTLGIGDVALRRARDVGRVGHLRQVGYVRHAGSGVESHPDQTVVARNEQVEGDRK